MGSSLCKLLWFVSQSIHAMKAREEDDDSRQLSGAIVERYGRVFMVFVTVENKKMKETPSNFFDMLSHIFIAIVNLKKKNILSWRDMVEYFFTNTSIK